MTVPLNPALVVPPALTGSMASPAPVGQAILASSVTLVRAGVIKV